nr:uncharacterized protein LOC117866783 isoform X2 [Setaria viridis]
MAATQSSTQARHPTLAKNAMAADEQNLGSTEYQLKKYLLLLATLVATVTYAAGLNLPGGSWLEGGLAGDSILRETNYRRYIVFYYFNAISFAASLLLSLLLLFLQKDGSDTYLLLMWTVMLVDVLGLMGAYAAGGSNDEFTTVCASVLVSGASLYAAVAFLIYVEKYYRRRWAPARGSQDMGTKKLGKKHEVLLVLAIFAATVAYIAGLNPPGGFWRQEGHGGAAGHPVLQGSHPRRYKAFFFCNTTAFAASLLAIMLTVDYEKLDLEGDIKQRVVALYGLIVTALLGLGGAYAAGSCRDGKHSAYVLLLVLPVGACIALQYALVRLRRQGCCGSLIKLFKESKFGRFICSIKRDGMSEDLKRTSEYIQLLATLAATIAYQAGLDPPGGVWAGNGEGHNVGDPILLTTHPGRYKIFFYFNSAAFVASIVIVIMLQNEHLVRGHALEVAMILDFFGLIGAYAAGSCRDTSTSIYTVALAGSVLIYVVIHIVFFTLDHSDNGEEKDKYENHREVLLLLAILAATLTYQAGMTPPGGFWEDDDKFGRHHAGFPVLQDKFPRRYKAFFYCNAFIFVQLGGMA